MVKKRTFQQQNGYFGDNCFPQRARGVEVRGLKTKRSHGAISYSRFTTILRSEGSPHGRGMRNKFRLPLVAVFTYSFQNHGSLHLVQAAVSKKLAHIRTVDFSTAFCRHGGCSFTPTLCPVQKNKIKVLGMSLF